MDSVASSPKASFISRIGVWLRQTDDSWFHCYLNSWPWTVWRWRGRNIAGCVGTSIAVFLLGLLFAICGDFVSLYVKTVPIYLGLAGISWVLFWAAWGDDNIRHLPDHIALGFPDRVVFRETFQSGLSEILSRKRHLGISAIAILIAWIVVPVLIVITDVGIPLFPEAWSHSPGPWLKIVTLDLYAVPILLLLVSTSVGSFCWVKLFGRIAKLAAPYPLSTPQSQLRPLVSYGIKIGFAWATGIATFVIFFRVAPGSNGVPLHGAGIVMPIIGIGGSALWALVLVGWPQYKLHSSLKAAKTQLIMECLAKVEEILTSEGRTNAKRYLAEASGAQEYERTSSLLDQALSAPEWVIPVKSEIVLLLLEVGIPVFTVFVKL